MADKDQGGQNLHLDEITGEMVSKNELKKRQKQREKDQKRQAKQQEAGEQGKGQSGESTSKAYYEGRVNEVKEAKTTGQSPYIYKVHVTKTVKEFVETYQNDPKIKENGATDESILESLCGRIMSIRSAGQTLTFLALEESGDKVQIFCSADKEAELMAKGQLNPYNELKPNQHTLTLENIKKSSNYEALKGKVTQFYKSLDKVKRGDIINVVGYPGRTNTGELSIFPISLEVTCPCLHMLPKANQKLLDVEARYGNRAMDLFFNKKAQVITQRIRLIQFMKDIYIRKYDFLEVETPLLHPIKGGANAKPFVTHYNDLDQDVYLRISPELYLKQLTIGGIHRVFDMNRNFRNESIDQTHMPEFTMVESYCAYWDLYDQLEFVEDFISSTVRYSNVTFRGVEDREDNPDLYRIQYTDWKGNNYDINFKPPFKRVDIMSSLNSIISEKLGETVEIPKPYGSDECNKFLQNLIFERLLKKKVISQDDLPTAPYTTSRMIDNLIGNFLEKMTHDPMFLLHHPKIMSPLAKPKRDDPEVTERFELFCAMFELANAYTELNDPLIQRENFESQLKDKDQGDDEAQDMDEGFLKAMEYGMVQQSGLGIGIDRFMMLLCNQSSIREVIAFPPLRRKRDELGTQK